MDKARLLEELENWLDSINPTIDKNSLKQEFELLVVNKDLADVWKFVTCQVKSVSDIKTIRGNLALYRRGHVTVEQTDHPLLSRRRELVSELQKEKSELSQLRNDLQRNSTLLQHTGTEKSALDHEIDAVRIQVALLQQYQNALKKRLQCVHNYSHRIAQVKRNLSGDPLESSSVEGTPAEDVNRSYGRIKQFFGKMLDGEFGANKSTVQTQHETLWTDVSKAVEHGQAANVLQNLTQLSRQETQKLEEETNNINIGEEIKKLKYEYGSGGELLDTSSDPSLLQSVQQLMQETQEQHVQSFLRTEQTRTKNELLRKQTKELQQRALDSLFQSQLDNKQAQRQFEAELQLVQRRATLTCLTSQAADLAERVHKATKERTDLEAKHKRIQDFAETVKRKQGMIQVLVKQNTSSRSLIEAQQLEVEQYSSSCVLPVQRSLSTHVPQPNAMSLVVPLRKLHTLLPLTARLQVGETSVSELEMSITDVFSSRLQCSAIQALAQIRDSLHLKTYKCGEALLEQICEMNKSFDDSSERELVKPEDVWQCLQILQDLYREVGRHDAQLENNLLPALEQRLEKARNCDMGRLERFIHFWWDQPAQSLVHWVKVEGKTVDQWRAERAAVVTALREAR